MRTYKPYAYVLPVLLTLSVAAKAQDVLTFGQAQDIMYRKNTSVKAVIKNRSSLGFQENAAKGLRFPTISAFGSATIMSHDVTVDLTSERQQAAQLLQLSNPAILGNWNFVLQKKDIEFGGVGLLWPVFTGGKINAAQHAAGINTQIGDNEIRSTKDKLVSELAERYFQAKLAIEALKVRKEVFDGMSRHLQDALKLQKNGVIAEAEALQAKVGAADANTELLAAGKDVIMARAALANTLEVDSINADLSSAFFISANLKPLVYYQDLAVANYPEIEKLRLQGKLVDQQVLSEKSDYYPQVAVLGSKVFASNNFPLIKNPAVAGVTLTYTIFNGEQRKNKVSAAEASRDGVSLMQKKAENDIRTLVEKLYNDLQKQAEQLQGLETSLNYANELLRVRQKGFSEGMSTSVDVIDASLHLAAIELQKIKTNADYDISLARLFEYSGLSQDFVKQTQP